MSKNIPSSPLAQSILQLELGQAYNKGYSVILQASERYAYLEEKEKQGGVTNLPSFTSQPPKTDFEKPGTKQYRDDLDQKRLVGLKQIPLDKDEALQRSIDQKIGDYNTRDKHEILQVTDR